MHGALYSEGGNVGVGGTGEAVFSLTLVPRTAVMRLAAPAQSAELYTHEKLLQRELFAECELFLLRLAAMAIDRGCSAPRLIAFPVHPILGTARFDFFFAVAACTILPSELLGQRSLRRWRDN